MKKEEKEKLWQKDIKQLRKLKEEKSTALEKALLNLAEEKDKNKPKKLKREIAVLLTIIKEKSEQHA